MRSVEISQALRLVRLWYLLLLSACNPTDQYSVLAKDALDLT